MSVASQRPESDVPPEAPIRRWPILFANLSLRAATSLSRFVLVVMTARLLSLADLGELGVIVAIVNLASTGLGLNYFQVTTRELLDSRSRPSKAAVRDQAVVLMGAYVVGGIVLGVAVVNAWVSARLAGWLAALTLVDHLGLELQRLLVVRARPVTSNIVLFLRSGAWVLVTVGAMCFWPPLRHIETIWWGWLVGGLLGIGYGGLVLLDLPWSERLASFDAGRVRRGLRSALVLLAALVCLRAITSVDRLILERSASPDVVGVYVFFAGVANNVFVLADSGVLSTRYPDLVRSYQVGAWDEYARTMRAMVRGAGALVAVLVVGTAVLTPLLLDWVDKPELTRSMPVLWVLLVGTAAQVGMLLLRNALYVRGADLRILVTSASGAASGLVVAWLATPRFGAMGAAFSTLVGAVTMIVVSGWLLIFRTERTVRSDAIA